MSRSTALAGLVVAVSLVMPARADAHAQQYHVRVDAGIQAVAFRGLTSDSIEVNRVVVSADGGFTTPDGLAARCGAGAFCYFYRPGPELHGLPFTSSASLVLWGLGVRGLTFHTTGRVTRDLGRDDVWPATEPAVQLIDGYLEYERSSWLARAGRQLVASRLEPIGFDGGWLRRRWEKQRLDVTGYAGWGLGQAVAVSATNPALNPLDEWRPRDRQIVAGADVAWSGPVDARAEYRREVDPVDDHFVSERIALSASAHFATLFATGGLDYNLAEGHLGSTDLTITSIQSRASIAAGARRYRPYFSLWTLWGAFSPVAYNAVFGSVQYKVTRRVTAHARGEHYAYDDAGVSTGLVTGLQDRGWRMSAGVTAALSPHWTTGANYLLEFGPGASSRFADGSLSYTPSERYTLRVYGGHLARPLELRYYDASSRWFGARAELQTSAQRRVWGDVSWVHDARNRPDAGVSLNQVRVRGGVSFAFGSSADRAPLPPARKPGA